MAVPKRKTSRSATRSRKSANMRLAPPRALAVPELRRVAAPAHRVQQLRLVPRPAGPRRRLTRADGGARSGDRDAGDRDRRDGRRPRARRDRRGRARGRRRAATSTSCSSVGPTRSPSTCPAVRRPRGVEVLAASEVIEMDDDPANAVRTQEGLVARARAPRRCATAGPHAMVGAGNTGATMAAALLALAAASRACTGPRSRCRSRCSAPTGSQLLVDGGRDRRSRARVARRVGASSAREYARVRLGVDEPTVALLSNGEEAGQGRRAAQGRRAQLLAEREGLHRQRRGPRPHAPARRRDRHRRVHRQRRAEDARRLADGLRRRSCSACSTSPDVGAGAPTR